jgi:hydrogenase maturation protease
MQKTLIVGLGNPILGDDGVGWRVAEEVCRHIPELSLVSDHADGPHTDAEFAVECVSLGGIGLMEHLIGFDNAILIDSFRSDEGSGGILILHLDDLPNYSAYHTTSAHDTSLQTALDVGRQMGAKLPEHIMVVGITTEKCFEFSEELSPAVREAVPQAAQAVLDLLKQMNESYC